MTDWAQERRIWNYGINRKTDSRILKELLSLTLGPIILAAILVLLSWERSEIIDVGYESQRLIETERALLRAQRALALEEETLKDPQRIDAVARRVLGMAPLRPHQLLPPTAGYGELSATLALARILSPDSGPRKPVITN